MSRDDVHGDPKCPTDVAAFLLRVGGTNPHGEPLYRVVHTSTAYKKQGGAWKIWDSNLTLQERGGLVTTPAGLLVPSLHTPKRVEIGVKEVKKYGQAGFENVWVLERWMPAHCARSQWYQAHVPGHPDIPLLGPYPEQGTYVFAGGPTQDVPSLSMLQEAMNFCQSQLEKLGGNLEQMMRDEEEKAVAEYEAQHEKQIAEDTACFKDALSPWTSTSLGAGRWRNEMAKKAGVTEHA